MKNLILAIALTFSPLITLASVSITPNQTYTCVSQEDGSLKCDPVVTQKEKVVVSSTKTSEVSDSRGAIFGGILCVGLLILFIAYLMSDDYYSTRTRC